MTHPTPRERLAAFLHAIRVDIQAAKVAGADENDLAVALLPGYLPLAAGWPVVEVDGESKVLVPIKWAEDMVRMGEAEASF